MKYYNFAFVGTCVNSLSFHFDQIPICITCNEIEKKETFKLLRKMMMEHFKNAKLNGKKSYKFYKFGLTISIINSKEGSIKHRKYYINPLALKQNINIIEDSK